MKKTLPQVTLVCIDCTPRVDLAVRAIERSLEQCEFGAVKLLTDDASAPYGERIEKIRSLEEYSNFCIRDLWKHIGTSHALLIQSDGYVVNGNAWTDDFLKYDYIGAPWLPSNAIGNGGFSLRSRKLLTMLGTMRFGDSPHPEDNYICIRHRKDLFAAGARFASLDIARRFAFEGRSWNNGIEWAGIPVNYAGQFGFHSWLTPGVPGSPKVFHHSGEWGDVIYSLPVIKALGGGVLFLSADNRYPYPRPTRETPTAEWVNNIKPLLEAQDYIERVQFTHGLPFSTSYDLNKFRLPWKNRTAADFDSIYRLHLRAFELDWPEDEPWLSVPEPITVPGRDIVVSRSPRYHDDAFPWYDLVQKAGDRMVFVGTESEANIFQGFGAPKTIIPHYRTANLLEVARVIAGAGMFIGNQSAPLAIALGLGVRCLVEEWPLNPNCRLERCNARYFAKDCLKTPKEWLS